jgi:hypothetical protein
MQQIAPTEMNNIKNQTHRPTARHSGAEHDLMATTRLVNYCTNSYRYKESAGYRLRSDDVQMFSIIADSYFMFM